MKRKQHANALSVLGALYGDYGNEDEETGEERSEQDSPEAQKEEAHQEATYSAITTTAVSLVGNYDETETTSEKDEDSGSDSDDKPLLGPTPSPPAVSQTSAALRPPSTAPSTPHISDTTVTAILLRHQTMNLSSSSMSASASSFSNIFSSAKTSTTPVPGAESSGRISAGPSPVLPDGQSGPAANLTPVTRNSPATSISRSATPLPAPNGSSAVPGSPASVAVVLPPEPSGAVDDAIKEKLLKFRLLKTQGIFFNGRLRAHKTFRNPHILEKLVERWDIDEIGSNYPVHLFDPHGFDSAEFYDNLAMEQKKFMERQQMEKSNRSKVEFVNAESKPLRPVVQIVDGRRTKTPPEQSGDAAASGAGAADASGQASKRSKWDQSSILPIPGGTHITSSLKFKSGFA